MKPRINDLGQPIGDQLDGRIPARLPEGNAISGRFCRLEPLNCERHAADLHKANKFDAENRMWTYMSYGPFATLSAYQQWMKSISGQRDPVFFAIMDLKHNVAVGVAAYLRIDPLNGTIEVGHLAFSPLLQKTPIATEAMYLMMRNAFDCGYRRYEWKCDSLNKPSIDAAARLGFIREGLFRQAVIYKGRNRDTVWFSILDREWPPLHAAFERWLAPANFNSMGTQVRRLSELIESSRSQIASP